MGAILLAFYVGAYFGGVAALWTVTRVVGREIRWRAILPWPAALGRELERHWP